MPTKLHDVSDTEEGWVQESQSNCDVVAVSGFGNPDDKGSVSPRVGEPRKASAKKDLSV